MSISPHPLSIHPARSDGAHHSSPPAARMTRSFLRPPTTLRLLSRSHHVNLDFGAQRLRFPSDHFGHLRTGSPKQQCIRPTYQSTQFSEHGLAELLGCLSPFRILHPDLQKLQACVQRQRIQRAPVRLLRTLRRRGKLDR